jgi:hypothetical protein
LFLRYPELPVIPDQEGLSLQGGFSYFPGSNNLDKLCLIVNTRRRLYKHFYEKKGNPGTSVISTP